LNSEIKTRWVSALRSGDFQQGKSKLALKEGAESPMMHCCLGVLCELAVEDGIVEAENLPWGTGGEIRRFADGTNRASTQLPSKVAQWAGLRNEGDMAMCDPYLYTIPNPLNSNIPYSVTCSEANDGYPSQGIYRKSFSEIADLIEENL
jgi:hypothetical protein